MAIDNLNSKHLVTDAIRDEFIKYYKHYQEKLLQVTARNRSVSTQKDLQQAQF